MPADENHKANAVLQESLSKLNSDLSRLNKDAKTDLDTLLSNAEKCKGVLAVVITSLVKKVITPSQDIRKHQAGMDGGYSGRVLDTAVITPFLSRNNFPSMGSGSGWLTRSLEQGSPYNLDYRGAIKPPDLKKSFLRTLDRVERDVLDPKIALEYLLAGLVELRNRSTSLRLAKPTGLSIETIVTYLDKHFTYSYSGSGASRLPVLAIYAAYTQMMKEVGRYRSFELPLLLRHNAADRQTDAIGDIQVLDKGKHVVEAVEVKHLIPISPSIIQTAYEKFKTQPVTRYYLLTTDTRGDQHSKEITDKVVEIQKKCNCQVIVNGVEPTLKYYLRLLENPDTFVITYAELLESDPDIKFEHREAWNKIVEGS